MLIIGNADSQAEKQEKYFRPVDMLIGISYQCYTSSVFLSFDSDVVWLLLFMSSP